MVPSWAVSTTERKNTEVEIASVTRDVKEKAQGGRGVLIREISPRLGHCDLPSRQRGHTEKVSGAGKNWAHLEVFKKLNMAGAQSGEESW